MVKGDELTLTLNHIHGGNLQKAARKYGLEPSELLDFSANINPLGPSQKIAEAIAKNLRLICHYPDPECLELKEALSAYLNISSTNLLVGNGTSELIYLLVRVMNYQMALIPVPTFSEYSLSVLSSGGRFLEISMPADNGFSFPLEQVIAELPGKDILFLCNPNNPTGCLLDVKTLEEVLDAAAKIGTLVVIDEAFMDFVDRKEKYSLLPAVKDRENLVVLYSLTKFFAIPGLRLGVLAARSDLIKKLEAGKDPWSVNALAQVAGVAGLQDQEYIKATKNLVPVAREQLFQGLAKIPGFKPLPGAANFLLVDISGTKLSSTKLTDLLGRKGILVRDCLNFSGLPEGDYIRVAVRTVEENEKLLEGIKEVLRSPPPS